MVLRSVLRPRAAAMGGALVAGGLAWSSPQTIYADSPRDTKRPIYDDDSEELFTPPSQTQSSTNDSSPKQPQSPLTLVNNALKSPSNPTVTDQVASQVRRARLFLYAHSLAAETSLNNFLSRALNAESRFTNTIASLAPSLESGERLLPGSIYVLVSAMAGSIVSRNRGIVLRTATPLAVGTVAAWTLLPVTMGNVSELVFEYEKKVPGLAEGHVRARTAAEDSWYRAVAHSGYARLWMEGKIGEGREALEGWVRKGN